MNPVAVWQRSQLDNSPFWRRENLMVPALWFVAAGAVAAAVALVWLLIVLLRRPAPVRAS